MKEVLHSFSTMDYHPQGDYSFLSVLGGNSYIYYSLVESLQEYKLKNLYRFIYLRILKLGNKYEIITPMEISKGFISPSSLNTLLEDYIQDNKLLAVLIIHAIHHYHYPKKTVVK